MRNKDRVKCAFICKEAAKWDKLLRSGKLSSKSFQRILEDSPTYKYIKEKGTTMTGEHGLGDGQTGSILSAVGVHPKDLRNRLRNHPGPRPQWLLPKWARPEHRDFIPLSSPHHRWSWEMTDNPASAFLTRWRESAGLRDTLNQGPSIQRGNLSPYAYNAIMGTGDDAPPLRSYRKPSVRDFAPGELSGGKTPAGLVRRIWSADSSSNAAFAPAENKILGKGLSPAVRRHEMGHWAAYKGRTEIKKLPGLSMRQEGSTLPTTEYEKQVRRAVLSLQRADRRNASNWLHGSGMDWISAVFGTPAEEVIGHYLAARGTGAGARRLQSATSKNWRSEVADKIYEQTQDPGLKSMVEHLQRNYKYPGGRLGRPLRVSPSR